MRLPFPSFWFLSLLFSELTQVGRKGGLLHFSKYVYRLKGKRWSKSFIRSGGSALAACSLLAWFFFRAIAQIRSGSWSTPWLYPDDHEDYGPQDFHCEYPIYKQLYHTSGECIHKIEWPMNHPASPDFPDSVGCKRRFVRACVYVSDQSLSLWYRALLQSVISKTFPSCRIAFQSDEDVPGGVFTVYQCTAGQYKDEIALGGIPDPVIDSPPVRPENREPVAPSVST